MGQILSVFVLVIGIAEAAAFLERFRRSYLPLLGDDRWYLRHSSKNSSEMCPIPRTRRSLVGALVRGTADKIWSKKPSDKDGAKPAEDVGIPSASGGSASPAERRKVSADPVFPTVVERQEVEESVVKGPTTARPIVKSPLTKIPPFGPEYVRVGKPVSDGDVAPDLPLAHPPPPSPMPPHPCTGTPQTAEGEKGLWEDGSVGGEEEGAVRGVLRVVKSPLTRVPPVCHVPSYSARKFSNDASTLLTPNDSSVPKLDGVTLSADPKEKSRLEYSSAGVPGERDGVGDSAAGMVEVARGTNLVAPNGPSESASPEKRRSEDWGKASPKAGKEVSWAEDVKHIERGDKGDLGKDVKFPSGRIRRLAGGADKDGEEEAAEAPVGRDAADSRDGEDRNAREGALLKKVLLEDGEKIEIPPPPSFPPPLLPPGKEDPGELRIRVERPRSSRSPSSSREEVTLSPGAPEGGERRGRGEATVEGRSNGGDVKVSQPPRVRDDSLERREGDGASHSPRKEAFWLIFSGEYTKAMSKEWHSGHFCCWQCDESLTGQRYVLRDDHPYCVRCYESVFANLCEQCNKTIGIDSKDLSYKDKHWHEACFLCTKCRVSLVDKQFGSKADKIYCGNCYDAQFASRCDGCGEIFRAGTKKMEYKTRQWHEKCFCCCVCKTPIGTRSFIPREQEIYCASCYEEKFATRCVKCNKIITTGGVTYKNEPWHRECFTCTHCSTSLAGQRFTSRDEKPYCADCFGELFAKRCVACSRPITGIGGTRFISFEDRHWHNDCFICASCKTSLVGRGFITDGEDIICPECAKQKLM